MKKQTARTTIQILGLGLTMAGIFINFKWTMAIVIAFMVIGGTFYCGWLCPYGTIQEFSNKLARLFKIKQRKIPNSVHKYMKYSRYVIFVCASLLTFSFIFEILSLDPRSNLISILTGSLPSILALVVMISFTLLSMVYERFFCKYLCFEGAKYGLMSMFRPITIRRDKEKCIGCGQCDRACSMSIEVSKFKVLRSPNCINCLKCVESCPVDETLTYGFKSDQSMKKYMTAVGILVILAIPTTMFIQRTNAADAIESINVGEISNLVEEIQNIHIGANLDVTTEVTEETQSTTNTTQTVEVIPTQTAEVVSTQLYNDGTYTGFARGFRGNIYVEVTVKTDEIKEITVTDHRDDRKWYNRAVRIIDDMLSSNSTDVDLVGGATYTSEGIKEAVIDALEKAK